MGKLFDRYNNINKVDNDINNYLKEKGFYEAKMNPRFLNGFDYDELTTGKPCLRHDSSINDGYTLRIFINHIDIYYEVQTPWGSLETSGRYEPSQYPSVEAIDELLDVIMVNTLI